jgi:HPt (histidine-containing phosphotransfer) domain-containing protein
MRFQNTNPKICDVSQALARMGGNVGLLKQIAAYVEEDFPSYLSQLRTAVHENNCKQVQLLVHGIKGMAVSFDGQATLMAAVEVEELAQAEEWSRADQTVSELEQEFSRLSVALHSELAKL